MVARRCRPRAGESSACRARAAAATGGEAEREQAQAGGLEVRVHESNQEVGSAEVCDPTPAGPEGEDGDGGMRRKMMVLRRAQVYYWRICAGFAKRNPPLPQQQHGNPRPPPPRWSARDAASCWPARQPAPDWAAALAGAGRDVGPPRSGHAGARRESGAARQQYGQMMAEARLQRRAGTRQPIPQLALRAIARRSIPHAAPEPELARLAVGKSTDRQRAAQRLLHAGRQDRFFTGILDNPSWRRRSGHDHGPRDGVLSCASMRERLAGDPGHQPGTDAGRAPARLGQIGEVAADPAPSCSARAQPRRRDRG